MITYLTEKEIKDFISNEALDITTSKRLLNKVSLSRIYTYIKKDVVAYFNDNEVITEPLEIELLDTYVKPITLTLLELTHVQYKGQVTNIGLKQQNSVDSVDTEKDVIQSLLYSDLGSLKKAMDLFLCDNKDYFTMFKIECECETQSGWGGFYAV